MKKLLCLLMAMLMLIPMPIACQPTDVPGESSDSSSETDPPKEPAVILDLITGGETSYTIVRSSAASSLVVDMSIELKNAMAELAPSVQLKEDFLLGDAKPGEYEILLGKTNRDESAEVLGTLKYDDYKIAIVGKKIVIAAHNDISLGAAVEYFVENIVSLGADGELKISSDNEYMYDHPYPAEDLKIGDADISEYKIVVAKMTEQVIKNNSELLVETIRNATGVELPIIKDSEEPSAYEIILGNTNREQSDKLYGRTYADREYAIDVTGTKIALGGANDEFTMRKAIADLGNMITESGAVVTKTAIAESKVVLTSACFSDAHNLGPMLNPNNKTGNYVLRKTHTKAIDLILDTRGQVDVVMVGGDLMSDYPHWNQSGWWPYKYFVEFKALVVAEYARLAKDGKVIYIAGNHDYAQGELSTDAPHTPTGNYNSSEFYFTGPMNETMGELADIDMHWITGTHTGDKYLLGYHYEVNGVHFIGLSPDPDDPGIWSVQSYGFHEDTLKWFKDTLKRIDPNGNEIIFVNCHYHLAHRVDDVIGGGQANADILPIIKGHSNLFWFFGHVHTGVKDIAQSHTSEMVVHYNKSGKTIDTPAIAESYGNAGNRGPTTVYMGAGRIDHDGRYFNFDTVVGEFGLGYEGTYSNTATPKVCQVMYITVYEDRVEFQSINVGTLKGYTVDDIIEPYTVYFYK